MQYISLFWKYKMIGLLAEAWLIGFLLQEYVIVKNIASGKKKAKTVADSAPHLH